MKYQCEVTIDLPREQVIELFDSTENLMAWMPGLRSFDHLSGEPGQVGAKSRLLFDENGRKMEMIETITSRNLPDEFSSTYEAKGVKNWANNFFYEEGANQTRWVADHIFEFSGFMRIIAFFMRGAFPKQTMTTMKLFKSFAENS